DKNSPPLFLQDESFRMRCEFDRAHAFSVARVDHADPAIAEADINSPGSDVVTHVIGVVFEVNIAEELPGFGIIKLAEAALVVRDEEPIQFGDVSETLRRSQTSDRVDTLAFLQIDRFDTVVA